MPNVASSLLHTPCRSGSPHGVFGETQLAGTGPPLNAVMTRSGAAAPLPWPATGSDATIAMTAANPIDASSRLCIPSLLGPAATCPRSELRRPRSRTLRTGADYTALQRSIAFQLLG